MRKMRIWEREKGSAAEQPPQCQQSLIWIWGIATANETLFFQASLSGKVANPCGDKSRMDIPNNILALLHLRKLLIKAGHGFLVP